MKPYSLSKYSILFMRQNYHIVRYLAILLLSLSVKLICSCEASHLFGSDWLNSKTYEIEISELVELSEKRIPIRLNFLHPTREGLVNGNYEAVGYCIVTTMEKSSNTVSEEKYWYEYSNVDDKVVIYQCSSCGVIIFQSKVEVALNGILLSYADKRVFYRLTN